MNTKIKRFLSTENLERMQAHFGFLFKLMRGSRGELDLYLRDNSFNLYYRGNSLAEVSFRKKESDEYTYDVKIHERFLTRNQDGIKSKRESDFESRFSPFGLERQQKNYIKYRLPVSMLHPFFQRENLNAFSANIKAVNYSEELSVEQQLINDNRDKAELIFIDRQIVFPGGGSPRIDLLALRQVDNERYSFIVVELKMGNNRELEGKVGSQLDQCISNVKANFEDYKKCYEENYKQNRMLGLIPHPPYEANQSQNLNLPSEIEIVERNKTKVDGLVVAVGYTGIAQKAIQTLKVNHPQINVKLLSLRLNHL